MVTAQALLEPFGAAGSSVKLVVLSACYSDVHAEALRAHVDCVVGMSGTIVDDAARNFAIGSYDGLGERESIAAAFRQGRAAISLEGLRDSDRPQLRVRDGVDASKLIWGSWTLGSPHCIADAGGADRLHGRAGPTRAVRRARAERSRCSAPLFEETHAGSMKIVAAIPSRSRVLQPAAMSQDVELGCRCGEIHGWLRDASPRTVNRVICYCDDCQAFLHRIGRADLLDARGGTDIVQVAPSTMELDRGADRVAGLRLKPRGLYRWYASCCQTPLGNTVGPRVPFVGIGTELLRGAPDATARDAIFGAPRGAILGKFAVGGPVPGSTGLPVRLIGRTLRLLLGWKLVGKAWPHPFFERSTRATKRPVTVLSPAERDALRPLCGPDPTAGAS